MALVITGSIMSLFISLYSCCHNYEKQGPVKKGTCRSFMIWTVYYFGDFVYALMNGITSKAVEHSDVDYSYYLGPDYDKNTGKHCSTIISNHTSVLDPVVYLKLMQPAFAASIEFKKMPLFNTLMNALDTIYIPRGGTEEERKKVLEIILERQEEIEKSGWRSPMLIYAEGGCTNGDGLMHFKKGGFYGEKTV